jgi:hypothetical protein
MHCDSFGLVIAVIYAAADTLLTIFNYFYLVFIHNIYVSDISVKLWPCTLIFNK